MKYIIKLIIYKSISYILFILFLILVVFFFLLVIMRYMMVFYLAEKLTYDNSYKQVKYVFKNNVIRPCVILMTEIIKSR